MPDSGWVAATSARSDSVSAPASANKVWVASTGTLSAAISAIGGADARAEFNAINPSARTFWLSCHAPDMSAVPSDATIVGVEWRFYCRSISDAIAQFQHVYQRKTTTNGANVGNNLASTPQNLAFSYGYLTFGSASSLGGATWTPAEVKDAGFGVAVAVTNTDGEFEAAPNIDFVESRVTWTAAASAGAIATLNVSRRRR